MNRSSHSSPGRQRSEKSIRVCLVLFLAGMCVFGVPPEPVNANEGDLDPTFGFGGKVTTDFGGAPDDPFSVAVKKDGKIVAAGYENGVQADFAIAQYNADGSLDQSFGSGGKVTT